jgi:hypothetical protein
MTTEGSDDHDLGTRFDKWLNFGTLVPMGGPAMASRRRSMSDPDDLIHCIYCSQLASGLDDSELVAILETARANNARLDITRMLLFDSESFFQVLEGPAGNVRPLYEVIRADPRHEKVLKLIEEPIEQRDFGAWTMGIAHLNRDELAAVPGLNDFFEDSRSLADLTEGRAKELLRAFSEGRWHASIGNGAETARSPA